jgi:enhancing lycopene biosynthesis protein 2
VVEEKPVKTKKKVGVILSGCGVYDGAEIHEATLTLYFLDRAGAEYVCMAPDRSQLHVVDHTKQAPAAGQTRNVLVESARIARGSIRDVAKVKVEELDAVILPGGFGAAKNLSTFAVDGADCTVDVGVGNLLRAMHRAKKPIGALCIAPVILAKLLGPDHGVRLTIGNDTATAAAIQKMGATHENTPTTEVLVDPANRIVTTPCYMTARGIAEVGTGAEKLVAKILELA